MKLNQSILKPLLIFTWIAPIIILLSFLKYINHPENQGEYDENHFYLIVSLLLMLSNTIILIILSVNKSIDTILKKALNTISVLLGTPALIALWLFLGAIFILKVDLNKPKHLRDECFLKLRNIYKAKNTYHFSKGYCPTAVQDSIIVTEVYRWGQIKSCGIILKNQYKEIDPSQIEFLTAKEKEEILDF